MIGVAHFLVVEPRRARTACRIPIEAFYWSGNYAMRADNHEKIACTADPKLVDDECHHCRSEAASARFCREPNAS